MTVGYWWNLEGLVNANAVAKTSLKVLVKNHLKFFDSSSLTRRTEWRFEEIMNLSLDTHSLTLLNTRSDLWSSSTRIISGQLVSNFTL